MCGYCPEATVYIFTFYAFPTGKNLPGRLYYSSFCSMNLQKGYRAVPAIETGRLTLRALKEADIEPLYKIQCDPEAMRYTYCSPSLEESRRRLWAYDALEEQLGYAPWVIVLRSDQRVIGWGGLNIDPFDPGWGVEVAYFFDPAYWGKGFATELVKASLECGFEQHALEEIVAFAHPENHASCHVLEKCGFRYQRFEPRLNRNYYTVKLSDFGSLGDFRSL
jgi:ribosomal-protein-alanine N-acetyltransferase